VAFVVNLTAFPFNNASLVVLAKEVINTSASGLGWLMGCYSLGALLGSLLIGSRNSDIETGKITFMAAIGWHVGIIAMSKITWFTPSLPVLALTGMMQSLSMVTMAMMILKFVTPEMRGRVLGLRQLSVYGLPLGLLCTGFISEQYGIAMSLVGSGILGLILLVFVAVKWPRIIKGPGSLLEQVI
jgi:sugar phosphate permease